MRRPPNITGTVFGGTRTRSALKRAARTILEDGKDLTVAAAAKRLGLVSHDIKNLRADNLPGIQLLLRLVRVGHYSPSALIKFGKLKKLPTGFSTSGAKQEAISKRVRALAKSELAADWAERTGLSTAHVFILRGKKQVGARTVAAFVLGGASAERLFFGTGR